MDILAGIGTTAVGPYGACGEEKQYAGRDMN